MMFVKVATTLLAVASAAFAMPAPTAQGSCSTGEVHCCDSIAPDSSKNDASLGGLIPINIQDLGIPIGVNCIPVSVIGLGSAGTCNSQAACCEGVNNTGLVPIGLNCSPINVGL